MQSPPRRIVISKAITTNGGIETTGLPPVIRFHLSAVQIVSAKPAAVARQGADQREEPHRAPRQPVAGQRLLELVEGHRAVGGDRPQPRARSSRMARVAVSTCAKTPRTVEVAISARAHPAPDAGWSP